MPAEPPGDMRIRSCHCSIAGSFSQVACGISPQLVPRQQMVAYQDAQRFVGGDVFRPERSALGPFPSLSGPVQMNPLPGMPYK